MKFKTITLSLAIAASAVAFGSKASAQQFVADHQGREVVVHSNPLPVILHRLVPPNYGRHITLREYQAQGGQTSGNRSVAAPSRRPVR